MRLVVGVNLLKNKAQTINPNNPTHVSTPLKTSQDGNIFRGCLTLKVSLLKDVLSKRSVKKVPQV